MIQSLLVLLSILLLLRYSQHMRKAINSSNFEPVWVIFAVCPFAGLVFAIYLFATATYGQEAVVLNARDRAQAMNKEYLKAEARHMCGDRDCFLWNPNAGGK